MESPLVLEQILRLKEYPAKLIIGRATESGVLVIDDDKILHDSYEATRRIERYEAANTGCLEYIYRVVPLNKLEAAISVLRKELSDVAAWKGLPFGDWK